MRLHRTISPDLPLLVVALEEEAAHLHVSELPVLVTGAGKVNAAVSVATILGQYSPSHLVNLGTAGALHDGLEGTHVIGTVIQHDLDDAAAVAGAAKLVGAEQRERVAGDRVAVDDAAPAVLVALSLLALRGYRLDEADLRPSSLAAHPSAIGGPGES